MMSTCHKSTGMACPATKATGLHSVGTCDHNMTAISLATRAHLYVHNYIFMLEYTHFLHKSNFFLVGRSPPWSTTESITILAGVCDKLGNIADNVWKTICKFIRLKIAAEMKRRSQASKSCKSWSFVNELRQQPIIMQ